MIARLALVLLPLAASVLLVSAAAPAQADVARRCGPDGCAYIHCNRTGDRCFRTLDIYGAYDGCCEPNTGYYAGDPYYGRFLVCDSGGDRCYGSERPWWNFREYYGRLGYVWFGDGPRYRDYDRYQGSP